MGTLTRISYKLFSRRKDEVGKKPFDYYSLFHIIFGGIGYLILYGILINFSGLLESVKTATLLGSLYAAVIWEIIENFTMVKIKFGKRKDELVNSLFDIVFTHIGSIFAFSMNGLELVMIIINSLIIAILWRNVTKKA